jgi:hypothetical protein
MISRYEVSQIIDESLKYHLKELHPITHCLNLDPGFDLYTAMHDLTALAKKSASHHDLTTLKQCLTVAEKLYREGEHIVQDVVENTFIYELSPKISKDVLPKSFYNVYIRQLMKGN